MASGLLIGEFQAGDGVPPLTSAASMKPRVGASAPAEQFYVWEFDAATDQYLDFHDLTPAAYSDSGFTVLIEWAGKTATTGNVVWVGAFRAIPLSAEDIDVAHTYDFNTVTTACAGTSGQFVTSTLTFSHGADSDNLDASMSYVFRLGRNADDGADTMSGFAQVKSVMIRET